MKIASQELDKVIIFQENQVNELIIENVGLFQRFLWQILQQIEGSCESSIFLTEEDKILSWEKNVEIIINPFQLDINQKKVLNRLYQNMSNIVQEKGYYLKLNELSSEIINLLTEIEFDGDISLNYSMNIEPVQIFKMMDVKIETEGKTLLEKLTGYIKIVSELLLYKLIIFVNIKSYLNEEELSLLYQAAHYEKVHLLLIESCERKTLLKENRIIIDSDMCEIL